MARTTVLTVVGLVLGVGTAQLACGDESDDPRAVTTCNNYCERYRECEDTSMQECTENCRQILDDCMDDEFEEALDRLDVCANESCDEFTECSFEAGTECIFGL